MVLPLVAAAALKPELKVRAPGVLEVEAKVGGNPGPPGPEPSDERLLLLDFLVESLASPALRLKGAAKKAPCKCFTLPTGKQLCHRAGYIGTLTQTQRSRNCSERIELEDGRRERFERFVGAVEVCKGQIEDIPKGEKLMPWLECMGREASTRGIEL